MESTIHETAVVESGAELGKGVSVGPFGWIQAGARVGDECVIGPHVTIMKHTTLGRACRVHAGCTIGDLPQDLGFKGEETFVRIGDRCVFREGVTVHRGTKAGTVTEIGDDCYLMAQAHCAHNIRLGAGVIVANAVLFGGYVEVGARAFISGCCLIHQFTRIGRLAMLGGGSGVSRDVPPFCTMRPQMTNVVLGLNVVGMRRAGFSPEERRQVKQAFRTLYFSGLGIRDAVRKVRETLDAPPALEMVEFVEQSKRGICVPDRKAGMDEAESPED